jgi:Fe-S-cluster containining protein
MNPCLTCGACCAAFRVSFYWAETDAHPFGIVPAEKTEQLNNFRSYMKGTNAKKPRCESLCGIVGENVSCSIYEKRPSPCRAFEASWENGVHNPDCDRARAKHGLPPLQPPVTPEIPQPEQPDEPDRPLQPLPHAA